LSRERLGRRRARRKWVRHCLVRGGPEPGRGRPRSDAGLRMRRVRTGRWEIFGWWIFFSGARIFRRGREAGGCVREYDVEWWGWGSWRYGVAGRRVVLGGAGELAVGSSVCSDPGEKEAANRAVAPWVVLLVQGAGVRGSGALVGGCGWEGGQVGCCSAVSWVAGGGGGLYDVAWDGSHARRRRAREGFYRINGC